VGAVGDQDSEEDDDRDKNDEPDNLDLKETKVSDDAKDKKPLFNGNNTHKVSFLLILLSKEKGTEIISYFSPILNTLIRFHHLCANGFV
jgi:hypothetical protein